MQEDYDGVCQALDQFVQNIHVGEHLSPTEAHQQFEKGLVEIVLGEKRIGLLSKLRGGGHSSNGLLITVDGYFITAQHCLLPLEFELTLPLLLGGATLNGRYETTDFKIRAADGTEYPVEKAWGYPEADFVLGKAHIPHRECRPCQYSFLQAANHIPTGISVGSMTRWDGAIRYNGGKVTRSSVRIAPLPLVNGDSRTYHDHFAHTVPTHKGDSGGIIVTPDSRLVGIISTGGQLVRASGNLVDYGTAVPLPKILEFLTHCRWTYFTPEHEKRR